MLAVDVTYFGALLAGLLSFVSPCVLPLVPPYLCFIGGVSLEELTQDHPESDRPAVRALEHRMVFHSGMFVLGFTTVFVMLGATATAFSQWVAEYLDVLSKVAGVVIVLLGLHTAGLFRFALLNRDVRFHLHRRPAGALGAYVVGLAFAFGWTPCVGPVLAGILGIAAGREEIKLGVLLLIVYSLGIGIPFIAAAFAVRPFMRFMQRIRPHLRKVEIAMGLLLVVMGGAIFAGSFSEVGYWLQEAFPSLTMG